MALFGLTGKNRHEKLAEQYQPQVAAVSALGEEFSKLSGDELKQRATKYQGQDVAQLKQAAPEIYAAVREASDRILKMRHFDVQIMGGFALLEKTIAEMKTGEGKTLVATLPLTLQALAGKGAHLVTVNDYLAQRDAEWMRPLYEFFGLTVGVAVPNMSPEEKRAAYAADITYGTNNEFGFDYLRDNMATQLDHMVQRDLHYAIVDEVDSILIDEARTPLIISAPDAESTQLYQQFSKLVPQLKENTHYNIDEKRKAATLTDEGAEQVEDMLSIENLYAEGGIRTVHHLEQALRAETLFQKDKEYVVRDGQVIIVDEFTGRLMPGRRFSEGLHQALEAKEGVAVQQESRTLATITFQNFFRLYDQLAGMTGTAVTSAEEFEKVYNLDVAVIPTNKELARQDKPDRIYATEAAKFRACVEEIKQRQAARQPVLVGTVAIEKSEHLSALLKKEGVPHEVLNAKQHEREAEIVAQAGQPGAVTISTNMAGRGTDIKLGEGVAELGGLFVLGTERHEARRIDNQLRGRSGRQGDPGETQFFVSLDDEVMRVFGGERIKSIMQRLNVPEDEPIENRLLSRALEGAQERVEGHYFDSRKQVLSYDDVLNRQRNAIYTLRRGILQDGAWRESGVEAETVHQHIADLIAEQGTELVNVHTGEGEPEQWDVREVGEVVHSLTGANSAETNAALQATRDESAADGPEATRQKLTEVLTNQLQAAWHARQDELGAETVQQLERSAAMRAIDTHWMDHLDTMDYLRTGIGLRGYGQRDPLVEYQKEGYQLFQQLLGTIKSTLVETVFKANIVKQVEEHGEAVHPSAPELPGAGNTPASGNAVTSPGVEEAPAAKSGTIRNQQTIGRNDPCHCGSGKKFKKCHGKA